MHGASQKPKVSFKINWLISAPHIFLRWMNSFISMPNNIVNCQSLFVWASKACLVRWKKIKTFCGWRKFAWNIKSISRCGNDLWRWQQPDDETFVAMNFEKSWVELRFHVLNVSGNLFCLSYPMHTRMLALVLHKTQMHIPTEVFFKTLWKIVLTINILPC